MHTGLKGGCGSPCVTRDATGACQTPLRVQYDTLQLPAPPVAQKRRVSARRQRGAGGASATSLRHLRAPRDWCTANGAALAHRHAASRCNGSAGGRAAELLAPRSAAARRSPPALQTSRGWLHVRPRLFAIRIHGSTPHTRPNRAAPQQTHMRTRPIAALPVLQREVWAERFTPPIAHTRAQLDKITTNRRTALLSTTPSRPIPLASTQLTRFGTTTTLPSLALVPVL